MRALFPAKRSSSGHDAFGLVRGYLRRRLVLRLVRLRFPRVAFGPRCDVRRGVTFRVGRGATVRIGEGCVIDGGTVLDCASGRLEVGASTVFGHHCTVAALEQVVIGRRCLIAELVSIRDHDHRFTDPGRPILEQGMECAPVVIGDDVWLGAKVTVTRGVTIGSGTVVGANSVVTRDLPAGVVAVGAPAVPVRRRLPAEGGSTAVPVPSA